MRETLDKDKMRELSDRIRNHVRRGGEPFRYALKVARMNLTPEEQRILWEASDSGGFPAFKRAVDRMTGEAASPEEYAEYHGRKKRDMR